MSKKISKNESITVELKGGGPSKISNFYKMDSNSLVSITWQKYVNSGCKVPGDFSTWTVFYENIELGNFKVKKGNVIDMINKFQPDSRIKNRYLKIGKKKINEGGTSSDKYHIKFLKGGSYTPCFETWNDH